MRRGEGRHFYRLKGRPARQFPIRHGASHGAGGGGAEVEGRGGGAGKEEGSGEDGGLQFKEERGGWRKEREVKGEWKGCCLREEEGEGDGVGYSSREGGSGK